MKTLIQNIKEFASGITDRRLSIYATSGCYYMFMSLVPTVMILCCILPYTPFDQETVLGYIELYFSKELGEIMYRIVKAVYNSNGATLTVSIFLTLFSASASMKALMRGVNSAYNFKQKDNFIIFSLKALLYMVILIIALLASLIIMVYGGKILHLIKQYIPDLKVFNFILSNSRYVIVLVLLVLFFTMLYSMMTNKSINPIKQLPGAIFSAITWVVFSYVFTIYTNVSDKFGAYGVIGTIMVAMMWIYYCFFFLLIGAYINSYLYIIRKRKNPPQ